LQIQSTYSDFANIFTNIAEISTDFARIFTKSKLLGMRLHPPPPTPVNVDTYERPTNWTKANNYKHLGLSKTKSKWKVCEDLAGTVHFGVTMENKNTTNPWSHVFHKW